MTTILVLLACAPARGNFTGQATYKQAATAADGSSHDPQPVSRGDGSDQPVTFAASFEGTGSFGDLASICLPTDGSFTGTSSSQGTMSSDGSFAGEVDASASDTVLTSTLGCVTQDLSIDALTSITITASITADTENCSNYCSADANAECESDGDRASCEADFAASCEEECTTQRSSIVAETTLSSGSELDSLNSGLDGDAFGSFSTDLTFGSMQ